MGDQTRACGNLVADLSHRPSCESRIKAATTEKLVALPTNLSIDRMIRVLALLCLAVLSMGEPEAEAKAVADPKADPYLLYGGYYGLGRHYGYGGYPYYRVYGKRSAEAEAEAAPEAEAKAEADPWYGYYGGYGHGYYGGHGLGYHGRYYGGHYG